MEDLQLYEKGHQQHLMLNLQATAKATPEPLPGR